MPIDLRRVQVEGLFDTFKLDVPIKDNILILVGENGSGKSTLINLIYYALTAQWDRLIELPFESCTITIGDKDHKIKREDLPSSKQRSGAALRYLQQRVSDIELNNLLEILAENPSEYWATIQGREELKQLSRIVLSRPMPLPVMRDIARSNPLYRLNHAGKEEDSGVKALSDALKPNKKEQVLFLPTYRRIEKELSDVFPDFNFEEIISPYTKSRKNEQQAAYIELVEFGMTDVAGVFKSTLTALDQIFRSELNKFTGSYLHNILQGLYNDVDASLLATDEVARTVDLMLSRIGEEILSEDDRIKLKSLLSDIESNQSLTETQRISAYFLTNLVILHQKQQEREIPVRKLVELVNQYLSSKNLEFNPTAFELVIKQSDTSKNCEVPLYGLSSGEKQIVSLFSHIFLSGCEEYFIVIDEPELSISVPWQRRFLQDLKDTGKCSGLIAVTHSPFVFDNSLSEYAHSISEFITEG